MSLTLIRADDSGNFRRQRVSHLCRFYLQ